LLDVAIQESDPSLVGQELASVARAMAESAELRRALTSPGIPQQVRINVVTALVSKMEVQPPVAKLMKMLADRGRLDLVPTMSEVYAERLLAHRNIVRATVTSATSLTAEQIAQLEANLSRMTGKQVQVETAVDSSMIGGMVTRIGSTVYDGSVRTQLAKMRQQLVEHS
jgi:F-type H+-transporting ATPase subunit delta